MTYNELTSAKKLITKSSENDLIVILFKAPYNFKNHALGIVYSGNSERTSSVIRSLMNQQ